MQVGSSHLPQRPYNYLPDQAEEEIQKLQPPHVAFKHLSMTVG